jgi:hypothetical protein
LTEGNADLVEEAYWEASGYVDSTRVPVYDGDNAEDLDPISDDDSAAPLEDPAAYAQLLRSLRSTSLPSPSQDCSDMELLAAHTDALDPASRALHAPQCR